MPAATSPFGLPPDEAIRWFREKGYALSFDWRDMWGQDHARAFTVAKATQLDLLADLREAVDRAIAEGRTLGMFRKELTPLLQERGWWGKQKVVDPRTGIEVEAQLGSPTRLRTIYETNLRQAMAAGRWERIERTAQARPFLRYVAIDDGRTRDEHMRWHGVVLPWDDPWWRTHYPPNGWGCRCKVQQLSERDMARFGYELSPKAPPTRHVLYVNERTGQRMRVPKGISPGFDYNAGLAPRGWQPDADEGIPLQGNKTWKDMGLPSMRELRASTDVEPVDRWHDIKGIADADERYVKLFGSGKPTPVTDPTGQQVTFDPKYLEHLWKGDGAPRVSFLPRAKQTIEDPAEVWLVPERMTRDNRLGDKAGSVVMRKVYIGIYRERDVGYAIIAHRTREGFAAWTLVPTSRLDSRRQGYLLYRRGASR